MGTPYSNIVRSRKLAERSYLYFKYPSKGDPIEFYLPFMENIDVSESQKPNYATYDLIGRAGSLYAYLGSKSREMTLKFNITLPNIVDYIQNVGLSEMFADNFRKVVMDTKNSSERQKFFNSGGTYRNKLGLGPEGNSFTPGLDYSNQSKFDYYTEGKRDIYQLDPSYLDGSDSKSGVRSAFAAISDFFNSASTQGFKIPSFLRDAWANPDAVKKGMKVF
jgi:hypothetical protein